MILSRDNSYYQCNDCKKILHKKYIFDYYVSSILNKYIKIYPINCTHKSVTLLDKELLRLLYEK